MECNPFFWIITVDVKWAPKPDSFDPPLDTSIYSVCCYVSLFLAYIPLIHFLFVWTCLCVANFTSILKWGFMRSNFFFFIAQIYSIFYRNPFLLQSFNEIEKKSIKFFWHGLVVINSCCLWLILCSSAFYRNIFQNVSTIWVDYY